MAIKDIAASTATSDIPWRTCQVCHALASIPPDEADALTSLLANTKKRYTELADDLRNDPDTPLDLHSDALSRHARGRCEAKAKLR